MPRAEFEWSYAACRKMDSLARKAYKKATGKTLPAGPVNHHVEQQPVVLLPLEPMDRYRGPNPNCGTEAGWHWHRRRNEVTCEACRLAHNAYGRAYKAKQRAKRQSS